MDRWIGREINRQRERGGGGDKRREMKAKDKETKREK